MKKSLIFLTIITMVSCESKISFTFLPEHSATGIYNRDNENKGKKYVYYSVLVNNLPKEKKDLEKLLSFYHLKFRDSIFNNPDMDTFLTWFYQKNHTTSYFINKADDPGGFSSEILSDYYEKFGIATIKTTRIRETNDLKTEITFTKSAIKNNY